MMPCWSWIGRRAKGLPRSPLAEVRSAPDTIKDSCDERASV